MAFADFPEQNQVVELLQRSLERGRLGHAYLFTGHEPGDLAALARTLAKTLNCQAPVRRAPGGPAVDCCDECASCRKIDGGNRGDVQSARPGSEAPEQKSLMGRYRLLGALLKKLGEVKEEIEKALAARSPLERYDDVDPKLREKWEEELTAAIEAEYRLQRSDLLGTLQWWLRDVWVQTLANAGCGAQSGELGKGMSELLNFPQL